LKKEHFVHQLNQEKSVLNVAERI